MAWFVMTHEYSDSSSFTVCGLTNDYDMALCWFNANDENNVYPIAETNKVSPWMSGVEGWKTSLRITQTKKEMNV